MRVYRCSSCTCGFAILAGQKKAGRVSCPLCKAKPEDVIELAPVAAIGEAAGARLAREALKLWLKLPSD